MAVTGLLAAALLVGCQKRPPPADLTQLQVAYAQLLHPRLPSDLGSLQGHTRVGAGYHSYLRFRLSDPELRLLLGHGWQTQACSELQQRIQLPASVASHFSPPWNPRFELSSRCYDSDGSNHWGRADHILVIDASGYAHFHGVAK